MEGLAAAGQLSDHLYGRAAVRAKNIAFIWIKFI